MNNEQKADVAIAGIILLPYAVITIALIRHYGWLDGVALGCAFWLVQRSIASIGSK